MSFDYYPYTPTAQAMKNPAIQLFGNRLFTDQSVSEFLVEFLLLVYAPKRFDDMEEFIGALPPVGSSAGEPGKLEYAPQARLNLKLFSFLGASRLESRHHTHRDHHEELHTSLLNKIQIAGGGDKEDVVRTIENLMLGFQGAGSGRTWCAQSFLPVSPAFLAGESIWNESVARRQVPYDWGQVTSELNTYISMNRHRFLARGGEVLYLQLCNALRQQPEDIQTWCVEYEMGLSQEEQNPKWLQEELEKAFRTLMGYCPATLTALAEFVDVDLDKETSQKTDFDQGERRFVDAGWCNAESWREGYLFGVDLLRLMQANLDVVERIYLLESACAMQVLRTLAMQSHRSVCKQIGLAETGYFIAVSAPEEDRPAPRLLSQHSAKNIEKMIHQALRVDEVDLPEEEDARNKALKDSGKYGSKLFVSLAKRIGLMVPKKGRGARFVLNEQLLRLLVVTTVPIGGRLTYDTFKSLLASRHGLVFDASGLNEASHRLKGSGIYLPADTDAWLQEMLAAAGYLIQLSDSCALVHNPSDVQKEVQ
ncbi:MAG: hypothetical protein JJU29_23635 [Verrucomicrobia bacterium]|nr:hypothetical protein [Verrucomicrobiota bacterium]MCH8510356.1 hypothetical protein [Kiritimatiellia bacterium]